MYNSLYNAFISERRKRRREKAILKWKAIRVASNWAG